ncbi:uncharacterized protein LOC114956487 isoform X1 [Acropora millepora]|uniref:uncharacterized protein LOC114956487 isoform X1 n=1 Tax=Acropora millepora TaxID=45264 RepID=UPI001CF38B9B|nr:uncharacterized protein LOC114956487 isoform X1 [Acropora millepora]
MARCKTAKFYSEEYETNHRHFYRSFHKGVFEGVWWSFVTMTTMAMPTTEYPKNIMGRSYAIVWFLIGIVLFSLFISSLTSSIMMSLRILDHRLDITRTKKVIWSTHPRAAVRCSAVQRS